MAGDQSDDKRGERFRDLLGDVRPLQQDRVPPFRKKRKPVPEQRQLDDQDVVSSLLSDEYEPGDVETGDELLFRRPGLQHSVIRKLRKGQYAVEGELDLHRRTADEARELLAAFLHHARNLDWRCVRIIHGKGYGSEGRIPVLKNKVNSWLRQKDEVLAFCSAIPRDGGTGAVYVLLKRATP